MQRTREKWKATESFFLCSRHSAEDCFEVTAALAAQFGIERERKLVPRAIPMEPSYPRAKQVHVGDLGQQHENLQTSKHEVL